MNIPFQTLLFYQWKQIVHGKGDLFETILFYWHCFKQSFLAPLFYLLLNYFIIKNETIILSSAVLASLSILWAGLFETSVDLRKNNLYTTYEVLGRGVEEVVFVADISRNIPHFLGIILYVLFVGGIFFKSLFLLLFLVLLIFGSFALRWGYLCIFYRKKEKRYRAAWFEKWVNLTNFFMGSCFILFVSPKNVSFFAWNHFFLLLFPLLFFAGILLKKIGRRGNLEYLAIEMKIAFTESGGVLSGIVATLFLGQIMSLSFLWFVKNNGEYFFALPTKEVLSTKYAIVSFCLNLISTALIGIFAFDVERSRMVKNQFLGNLWENKFNAKLFLQVSLMLSLSLPFIPIVWVIDASFWEEILCIYISLLATPFYNTFWTILFKDFQKKEPTYSLGKRVIFGTSVSSLLLLVPWVFITTIRNFVIVLPLTIALTICSSLLFYRLGNLLIKQELYNKAEEIYNDRS